MQVLFINPVIKSTKVFDPSCFNFSLEIFPFQQKLIPAQFGLVGLSLFAFGNAISGGVDVDGNGYPGN